MRAAYKIPPVAVVLLAVFVAAGCASRPAREAAPAAPVSPPQTSGARVEGREFRVDTAASLLTIRVYKGGPLSRAGHNHVVASHSLTGVAHVPDDPLRASFEVHFPVAELTVDEDDLRKEAGPDFPPGVPDDAKAGTRRNMLGPSLLEGERFQEIVLQSEAIQPNPAGDGIQAQVRVIVRDRASAVIVPLTYTVQGRVLRVEGELPLRQTDLGLTPFSLFGGALKVLDEIKVQFRIIARAAD